MLFGNRLLVSPVLVGRTVELHLLQAALESVQQGVGRFIVVGGEAGVGKSRLLAELCRRASDAHFTIMQGHCFEEDMSFPYAPWIDALRAFFSQSNPAQIRDLLGPLALELAKLLPELSFVLPDLNPSPALDAESEKRRLFEALAQFLTRLTEGPSDRSPLLLILEDVHWSDQTSLDLLHLVARRISAFPILLVASYRREDMPSRLEHLLAQFDRERRAEEIMLNPLTRNDVAAMVHNVLNIQHSLRADFFDFIFSLTEGNPFFVEETLKALVEAGDIFYIDGRWERKPAAEFHVPRSVQDAVQRRSEQLAPEARRLLSTAAVVGQHFDISLLQQLTEMEERDLLRHLRELIDRQLVVEQSTDRFAFRHALTREAIYARVLKRERKELHRTIGEALERLYAHPLDPTHPGIGAHLPDLAYHYYQAGVWDKALDYGLRAGEKAQALYAPREALDHFTHALDAAQQCSTAPPFELLRARAKAHEMLGSFDPARGDLEAALEIGLTSGDRRAQWQATLDLGLLWAARDYARSGEYLLRALDVARSMNYPGMLAQTLNRVGNWHLNRDELSQAQQYHQEALEIFQKLNDQHGVAETLELLGVTSYAGANVVQGLDYTEQAIPLHRQAGDRQGLVNCLIHLTLSAQFDTEVSAPGDIANLVPPGQEALRLAREMGWRTGEAVVLVNLAHCLTPAGDYLRALDALRTAAAIGEEINHRVVIVISHWLLGQLYHDLLASSEARQHLEQAVALAEASKAGLYTRVSAADLALACIAQNDLERAAALLSTMLDDGPARSRHLRACWNARAELALAEGDPTHALRIADDLITSSPNIRKYGPRGIPRISELRSRALAALGRPAEAESALLDAREGAREQGRRPLLWRIHVSLGKVYRTMARREEAEREFAAARALIHELATPLIDESLRENFLQRALATIPAQPPVSPRRAAKQEFGGLTAREREVAALITQGKSNAEIAKVLVTSKRTVDKHVGSILSKLGFTSRTQVVAWAIEKGLIRPIK